MDARQSVTLPPTLLAQLEVHLRNKGSKLSLAQAASAAINAWIAADKLQQSTSQRNPSQRNPSQCNPSPPDPLQLSPSQPTAAADSAPTQGYQWKCLFLPAGTELRMSTRESCYYARVVGDHIMFQGRRVSPRGMTLAIIGNGRNAWRDLWLMLPGERYWKQASRCRRDHERTVAGLPLNPVAERFAHRIGERAADQAADQAANQAARTAGEPGTGQVPEHIPATNAASNPEPSSAQASSQHAAQQCCAAGEAAIQTRSALQMKSSAHAPAGRPSASATPAEAVAAAATSMTESLKAMLALMARLSDGPFRDEERRINPARREEDVLGEHCAFD